MGGMASQAVHRLVQGLVRSRKALCAGGLVAMMGHGRSQGAKLEIANAIACGLDVAFDISDVRRAK
jgi:hypothetical protein